MDSNITYSVPDDKRAFSDYRSIEPFSSDDLHQMQSTIEREILDEEEETMDWIESLSYQKPKHKRNQ